MGLISLAKRAGKITGGEDMTKESIRFGRCHLAILAADAGANTVKSIRNSCAYYGVPCIVLAQKAVLGKAVGSTQKAVLGITDEGFAAAILAKSGSNLNGGGKYAETQGI